MDLNKDLKQKLEDNFKPLGIVPFTNCCRLGCTNTFGDNDPDFKSRKNGICFIRIDLGGMNYSEKVETVYAYYENFDYLMSHWDSEKELIEKWIRICDRSPDNCSITKPKDDKHSIKIEFNEPLILDEATYPDSDSYVYPLSSELSDLLKQYSRG